MGGRRWVALWQRGPAQNLDWETVGSLGGWQPAELCRLAPSPPIPASKAQPVVVAGEVVKYWPNTGQNTHIAVAGEVQVFGQCLIRFDQRLTANLSPWLAKYTKAPQTKLRPMTCFGIRGSPTLFDQWPNRSAQPCLTSGQIGQLNLV